LDQALAASPALADDREFFRRVWGYRTTWTELPDAGMVKETVPGFFDSAPIRKVVNSSHVALRSK
jgi:hypothetical protein